MPGRPRGWDRGTGHRGLGDLLGETDSALLAGPHTPLTCSTSSPRPPSRTLLRHTDSRPVTRCALPSASLRTARCCWVWDASVQQAPPAGAAGGGGELARVCLSCLQPRARGQSVLVRFAAHMPVPGERAGLALTPRHSQTPRWRQTIPPKTTALTAAFSLHNMRALCKHSGFGL